MKNKTKKRALKWKRKLNTKMKWQNLKNEEEEEEYEQKEEEEEEKITT